MVSYTHTFSVCMHVFTNFKADLTYIVELLLFQTPPHTFEIYCVTVNGTLIFFYFAIIRYMDSNINIRLSLNQGKLLRTLTAN